MPSTLHVLRLGHSVLCNPTGLSDNKMCAVAFPSRPLLQSVQRILNPRLCIADITTDQLLDHIDGLQGVEGIFEVIDCFCLLCNRKTYHNVIQVEGGVKDAVVSERLIEFD